MARAGPEPSTLYFLPLSSPERLQPAYCEPRQASTGWRRVHGHHERPRAVGVGRLQRDLAKPAKADLGHAAPGLQSPQGPHAAIDAAFAKRAVCDVDAQRVGVSDQRSDERRRQGVDARPRLVPRRGDFFPFVQRFPPANALKSIQYSANSLLNQALRLCSCATARQHSAYRTVFVDPFRRLRAVGGPVGPGRAGRHAESDRGINDCRSHGIIEFQTASWQPPLADRFQMQPHQGFGAAVENVERGAGTRIDLEQQRSSPSTRKSAEARPTIREGPGDRRDRRGHLPRHAWPERGGAHRAAITKRAARGRRRPLLAEAKHARAASIGEEQRRDRASSDALLVVDRARVALQPARRDMAAAGAALALGEPACALPGPFARRRGMGNAQAVELGEEALRRLEPRHSRGVLPSSGQCLAISVKSAGRSSKPAP